MRYSPNVKMLIFLANDMRIKCLNLIILFINLVKMELIASKLHGLEIKVVWLARKPLLVRQLIPVYKNRSLFEYDSVIN